MERLWRIGKLAVARREGQAKVYDLAERVIPGEYFFYALEEPWAHSTQCLRMTFSQSEEVVRRGVAILADEVAALSA